MNASVQVITPSLAKDYLKKNEINRPVKPKLVVRYAEAMLRGEWRTNGEPLIFAEDGTLMNGQHRLQACIEADKSFETMVVRGVPREYFTTLDIGAHRSYADILGTRHVNDAKILATAARILFSFAHGTPFNYSDRTGGNPTYQQLDEMIRLNPGLADSVVFVASYGASVDSQSKKLLPPSLAAVLHYMFGRLDKSSADQFFRSLLTGENLSMSDPVYGLREKLIAVKGTSAGKRYIAKPRDQAAWIIKVWNRIREGRPALKMIKYMGMKRSDTGNTEQFPEIV